MNTLLLIALAVAGALILILAYKLGKILLRILVGLAALALLGWGFWHFLLK